MQDIAQQLVDKWTKIIESYNIKIESTNLFRMNKYYEGYPDIEYCYKVTFNFDGALKGYTINERTWIEEVDFEKFYYVYESNGCKFGKNVANIKLSIQQNRDTKINNIIKI